MRPGESSQCSKMFFACLWRWNRLGSAKLWAFPRWWRLPERRKKTPQFRSQKTLLLFPVHQFPPTPRRHPVNSRKVSGGNFCSDTDLFLLFFFFKKKKEKSTTPIFSTSKRRPTCVSVCELFKSLVANWSSDTICLMTLDPMCDRRKKNRSFERCDVPCRPQETFYILVWFHFSFLLIFFFFCTVWRLTFSTAFFLFVFLKKKLFLRKK